jgi:hypothetical protein
MSKNMLNKLKFTKRVAVQVRSFSTTSPEIIDKEINFYASKKQTGVSLKSLLETGRGELLGKFPGEHKFSVEDDKKIAAKIQMQVACFLHHELPVRFAHRASRLDSSPILKQSGKTVPILLIFNCSHVYFSQYKPRFKSVQNIIRKATCLSHPK